MAETSQDYLQHPEYLSLLASVLENPPDDAPRLILADWLDDHDQPVRATFIRLQIELANLEAIEHTCGKDGEWTSTCAACGCHGDLCRIEEEIQNIGWDEGLDYLLGEKQIELDYCQEGIERGFLRGVKLACSDFMEQARNLFGRHPIVKVVLTDRKPLHLPHPDLPMFVFWWGMRPTATTALAYPDDLPDCLRSHMRPQNNDTVNLAYPTQTAALEDANNACVAYGRSLVGLPNLVK